MTWRRCPWGAVRVAGLPAASLSDLRLDATRRALTRLEQTEAALEPLRRAAAAALFEVVRDPSASAVRGVALALKRAVFNARELSPAQAARRHALPSPAAEAVERVLTGEAERRGREREFEATFTAEWSEISSRLRDRLGDARLLDGLLLTSPDHLEAARHLIATPAAAGSSSGAQIREATLARYLARASLRTTPFGSFAGVALVNWEQAHQPDREPRRVSVPQLNVALLPALLARPRNSALLDATTLRRTPLVAFQSHPERCVWFAGTCWSTRADGSHVPTQIWQSIGWTEAVARLSHSASGRSTSELAATLAGAELSAADWRAAIDQLIGVGYLERELPELERTDANGLRGLAGCCAGLGATDAAHALTAIAAILDDYGAAPPQARASCLADLRGVLDVQVNARSLLYEDVAIEGVGGALALPIEASRLRDDLSPWLALARASGSNAAHQLVERAFVARHGARGACSDLGSFLLPLLRDSRFMARLRTPEEPASWLHSRLHAALDGASGAHVALDPALFHELEPSRGPTALAAFIQFAARDPGAPDSDYLLITNGVQSGRHKYLSRYLGLGTGSPAALAGVREELARARPLPVELRATLGLNFQLHPRLTRWSLETPLEPVATADSCLRLSELTLYREGDGAPLRLRSARLGCDIEPLHLGFLRDSMLPDALLLLRALSPRFRDDTLVERMDLYAQLNGLALARGLPLPKARPRLTVGRLVIERAEWATPVGSVPVKGNKESYGAFFRRLERWRRDLGWPERGFARTLSRGTFAPDLAASRAYVDWLHPPTLVGLKRLLGGSDAGGADRWLVFSELLPAPENAHLSLHGEAHVSELLVQWEYEDD